MKGVALSLDCFIVATGENAVQSTSTALNLFAPLTKKRLATDPGWENINWSNKLPISTRSKSLV